MKESRLQEVMGLLVSAGFDLYSSGPNVFTSRMVSPLMSPSSADDSSSMLDLGADITTESGAVLTRARSSTDTSSLALVLKQLEVKAETSLVPSDKAVEPASTPPQARSKSHSPTSGEVRVLPPDLACVGLSDHNVENWSLKIIKLVAFPELIPAANTSRPSAPEQNYLYTGDGRARSIVENQNPLFEPFATISTPPDRGRREDSPSSSSSYSSGEDGYFSHSPPGETSSASVVSSAASRSYPDVTKSSTNMSPSFKPVIKRLATPFSPIDPVNNARVLDLNEMEPTIGSSSNRQSVVGFFSFTRTAEGSSLTTDVSLLASLFPPDERHMVICSGELDAVERPATDSDGEESDDNSGGILKCLQIDLRRFGLGEHQ